MSPKSKAKIAAYKTAHRESCMDSESDESDKENCKGAILNIEQMTVAEKKLFSDTKFSSDSESDGSDTEDSIHEEHEGYSIWSYTQLQDLIHKSAVCNSCNTGKLKLEFANSQRRGWCSLAGLKCDNSDCDKNSAYEKITTSPVTDSRADINVACVVTPIIA
jgi:hypothetical protein